jgi:hypothetical protein
MGGGSNKVSAKDKPHTFTAIDNIFPYTQVAREIGAAQGWSAAQIETFQMDMLAAIQSESLKVRNRLTGLPNRVPDDFWHLVHPDDVNEWLKGQGLGYRWVSPNIRIPAAGVESVVSLGSVTVETSPLRLPIVAEPAVGASVTQLAIVSVPSQRHSIKPQRRDSINPVIELAQSKCKDPSDTAEVWAQMEYLADNETLPFLAATSEGLKYRKGGSDEYFTRGALRLRLHPEKRAPRKNRP